MPYALQSIFAHKPVGRKEERGKIGHHQPRVIKGRLSRYPSRCFSSLSYASPKYNQFPLPDYAPTEEQEKDMLYLRIDEALRLRRSAREALASVTRLART